MNETAMIADRLLRESRELAAAGLPGSYEYIVCGAGSAGSAVAGRLAADPTVRVLLLEAGGPDDREVISNPDRWLETLGTDLDWGFVTAPNPHLHGRALPYAMGKVLGGGSSINVAAWSRGHKEDWDYFAAAANDSGWSYASVLELYRDQVEDWAGIPDAPYRGIGGMVRVQPPSGPHAFSEALLKSAEAAGMARFASANGELMEAGEGCALADETVQRGRRISIFRAYIDCTMPRRNLTVLTGAMVRRIVFEGMSARGVEFLWGGRLHRVTAGLEVVLAAGAVQTPKLLMQSGIGDPAALRPFGIEVKQALPGVGRNLQNHLMLHCVWEATAEALPVAPRSETMCFWKTDAALAAPNCFSFAMGLPISSPENVASLGLPERGWSLFVGMSPRSQGRIHLTGANAEDALRIEANELADPQDVADLKTNLERARAIGNAAALHQFTKREVQPGPLRGSDLERYLRDGLMTYSHQCGTARMGRDNGSVVDGRLRVRGVHGLRIADASVMPRVTRGNTMAPCVIIGERAAAMMQAEHGHSPVQARMAVGQAGSR